MSAAERVRESCRSCVTGAMCDRCVGLLVEERCAAVRTECGCVPFDGDADALRLARESCIDEAAYARGRAETLAEVRVVVLGRMAPASAGAAVTRAIVNARNDALWEVVTTLNLEAPDAHES